MRFHVMTLFPDMIDTVAGTSIIGRAAEGGFIEVISYNIRDFSLDRHKSTDDYPYGGGAGMVMSCQPVFDTYEYIMGKIGRADVPCIYLTPAAKVFNQDKAMSLSSYHDLILLCGHYEGVDERVLEEIVTDYVSIGDYVLTGGELAALVLIDSISRMVDGVLTNEESAMDESFGEGGLLEYPQYTRPYEWRGRKVPDILLSGHHANVDAWRHEKSVERTRERRPDLFKGFNR